MNVMLNTHMLNGIGRRCGMMRWNAIYTYTDDSFGFMYIWAITILAYVEFRFRSAGSFFPCLSLPLFAHLMRTWLDVNHNHNGESTHETSKPMRACVMYQDKAGASNLNENFLF